MTQRKCSQSSRYPILAGKMMIVIEMVYSLSIFEVHIIDIAYSCCPLEVKEWRPYVLILEPSFLNKGSPELMVPSFNNKNLLIEPTSILPLPRLHVSYFFLVILIFFILLLFFIVVIGF